MISLSYLSTFQFFCPALKKVYISAKKLVIIVYSFLSRSKLHQLIHMKILLFIFSFLLFSTTVYSQAIKPELPYNRDKQVFPLQNKGLDVMLDSKGLFISRSVSIFDSIGLKKANYGLNGRLSNADGLALDYDINGRVRQIGDKKIDYDIDNRVRQIGEDRVDYDINGRVRQIGNIKIDYDLNNQVRQIGDSRVDYNISGQVRQIGDKQIDYDINNRVRKIGDDRVEYDINGRVCQIGDKRIDYDLNDRVRQIGDKRIDYDINGQIREVGELGDELLFLYKTIQNFNNKKSQ